MILGVTGHVGEQFRSEGMAAGMNEVYAKPIYHETVKEIVAKYYN